MTIDFSADHRKVDIVARTVDDLKRILVSAPNTIVGIPIFELRQTLLEQIIDFSKQNNIEIRY